MTFKELIKKVESSEQFKEFKKKNPKAILYSAFFLMRDAAGNLVIETQQADYWLGTSDVATFIVDECDKIHHKLDRLESADKRFTALNKTIKVDLDDLKKIIKKEVEKFLGDEALSKAIIVLQKIEGKQVWNITCIMGFRMLRMHIDMDGKVLKAETGSLMDFLNVQKGEKGKKKN
ncbi:MAG: hypothetical protein NTX24_05140 [Candidatus Pacearchaeota archaeon]|nr:hypothetical protein [Candidatus Pacearchaeota archaeon]